MSRVERRKRQRHAEAICRALRREWGILPIGEKRARLLRALGRALKAAWRRGRRKREKTAAL